MKTAVVCITMLLIAAAAALSEGAVILNAAPSSVVADGYSQIQISAQLLGKNNVPQPNTTLNFATTGGRLASRSVVTDADGWAYNTLTASMTPGPVTVSAKAYKTSARVTVTFTESQEVAGYPPEGIYSLTGGGIPVSSLLANASVKGISARIDWRILEPQDGVFDWRRVDSMINQVGLAGKKISFAISAGVDTPEWVYEKGARKFVFIDDNVYHDTYGEELYCPMPWDEVYLAEWKKFIDAFGAKYNGNPAIAWVRVTGPMNTTTMDWNLQAATNWDKYIGTGDEFSDAKLAGAVTNAMDWFAAAFPLKPLAIAVGKTKITDSPPYLTAATAVADYGFATYPLQFAIQKNNWNGSMTPPEEPDPDFDLIRQHAPNAGAQMLWSATDDPFCRMNNLVSPCDPYTSLSGAMDLAIGYNLNFLEIYPQDIVNPDLQTVLERFYTP